MLFRSQKYITESTFFKALIESGEILIREGEIEHVAKGIIIASGHSKATSFVGRTALLVLFDELAMFTAENGPTSNAQEVYSRIGTSTMTAREYGRVIALSSVKCEGDYMETLVRQDWNLQEDGALVFNLSTFDFNPMLTKDTPSIKVKYIADMVSAERDFENIRPGSVGQFLLPAAIAKASDGRDPQHACVHAPMPIFRRKGEAGFEADAEFDDNNPDEREMSGLQVAHIERVPSLIIQSFEIGRAHV